MAIFPDPWLMLLQVFPFLTALFVLNGLLFGPLVEQLEGRLKATEGTRLEAGRLTSQAEARAAEVERRLAEARRVVADEAAAIRAEASKARELRLQEARRVADGRVAEAVAQVSVVRDAAAARLEVLSRGLADDIVERVLGGGARA